MQIFRSNKDLYRVTDKGKGAYFINPMKKIQPLQTAAKALLVAILSCCFASEMYAQDTTTVNKPEKAMALEPDTSAISKPDTLVATDTVKYNPNRALMLALLPGGGQWYNRQYWKTPVFAATVAGLTTLTVATRLNYNKHKNRYNGVLNNYALGIDDNTELEPLQEKKYKALRRYNLSLNSLIIFYGVNLADAYLNAHIQNDRATKRSPVKAAYRAMVLPGWGQVYNRKYWKLPIVYAGFAAAGTALYINRKQYLRYRNEYLVRNRPGYYAPNHPDPELAFITDNNILLGRKNVYRRYEEISIIAGTLWYAVTILDALIDAHLSDFDVSDDLSFSVTPFWQPQVTSTVFNTGTPANGGFTLSVGF